MPSLDDIAGLFASGFRREELVEDSDRVSASYTLEHLEKNVSADELKAFFDEFPQRDRVELVVEVGGLEGGRFGHAFIDNFESDLKGLETVTSTAQSDDEIALSIAIRKLPDEDGYLSLYDSPSFFEWLTGLSLYDRLAWFTDKLRHSQPIKFAEQIAEPVPWGTPSISANGFEPNQKTFELVDRTKVITKQGELVNFSDASAIEVSPYDFMELATPPTEKIRGLLNSLLRATTVLATADHCHFSTDQSTLHCRYRGVRLRDWSMTSENEAVGSPSACAEIFYWLYSGGEMSDKAGLLRNILSLRDSLEFDDAVLHSARSGYELYLKENISRYIDLKNRVTDYLDEIKGRLDQKADGLTKSFSGSNIAMITFFITVIIAQSGQSKQFSDFVTKEVLFLSYAFGLISILYLIGSIIGINSSIKRIEQSFSALKERYSDLFSPDDILKVFSEQRDLLPVVKECKKHRFWISFFWILTVLIIVATVSILSDDFINYLSALFDRST